MSLTMDIGGPDSDYIVPTGECRNRCAAFRRGFVAGSRNRTPRMGHENPGPLEAVSGSHRSRIPLGTVRSPRAAGCTFWPPPRAPPWCVDMARGRSREPSHLRTSQTGEKMSKEVERRKENLQALVETI